MINLLLLGLAGVSGVSSAAGWDKDLVVGGDTCAFNANGLNTFKGNITYPNGSVRPFFERTTTTILSSKSAFVWFSFDSDGTGKYPPMWIVGPAELYVASFANGRVPVVDPSVSNCCFLIIYLRSIFQS